jgi:hypothetical protein
MMLPRLLPCILAAAVIFAAPAEAKPSGPTSRYTKFDGCHMIDHAQLGEDWVLHKCKGLGGIPVWLLFTDSAYGHVGFGAKANVSGIYGAHRDDRRWPIEWRGRVRNGKFQPLAVIIRMDRPAGAYEGPAPNELIVFRLRPDGTSCVIAETKGSNEDARKIADSAIDRFACLDEPQIPSVARKPGAVL